MNTSTVMTARNDRGRGVLLGQLIGDSLVEVRVLEPAGAFGLAAGQPTDDSEMALTLARSIARNGGYDPSDVHASYVRWAGSSPFDTGRTTDSALRQGVFAEDSQENGALMRVSPIAVAYSSDPRQAGHMALLDAAMTHPHPRCLAVNQLFSSVLAAAVAGEWDASRTFAEFRHRASPDLLDLVEAAAEAPPGESMVDMGWVDTALHNALFELADGRSFEESLIRTVGRGGDTATNAAIVGALLGGVHGAEGIPQEWIDTVLACRPDADSPRPRPQEYWPGDALRLADQLTCIARG